VNLGLFGQVLFLKGKLKLVYSAYRTYIKVFTFIFT